MSELHRLRAQGRLVLTGVGYPHDGNRPGSALVGMWKRSGDVIREMPALLHSFGFDVCHEQIGGFGSVISTLRPSSEDATTAPGRQGQWAVRIGLQCEWTLTDAR